METKNIFATEFPELSVREKNARIVETDPECQQAIHELREIERFLKYFGDLSFGRDYVFGESFPQNIYLSLGSVLTSLELTMGSVIACCESACIADANTLLRKYRDDLFFYLYVSIYQSIKPCFVSEEECKQKACCEERKQKACDEECKQKACMEKIIKKWINNNLKNFTISSVLKTIADTSRLKDTVKRYGLEKSFNEIRQHLNNYVHSNGRKFYNQGAPFNQKNGLADEMKKLEKHARYMTMVFLLLLTLCSPFMVMSDDYIAYLEVGETPPENSQYWVAPFVEDFIKKNISLVDNNCLEYLRGQTPMQF